jgi:hypothetical protein
MVNHAARWRCVVDRSQPQALLPSLNGLPKSGEHNKDLGQK